MRYLIFVVFSLFASVVSAGEYCWSDKVTMVIVKNGAIYFTSQKSCPNWCQVDPAWSVEGRNMAYSQLLTAKTTGGNITFYWNEHEAGRPCQDKLPTYSKPSVLILN